MTEPISVTALNQYIKGLLDRDRLLSQVLVRSEISNYKVYPSGHHYFSLKDAESSIRCVMFRREAGTLRFRPENGMKVVVTGRVSLFPRDGVYQLYCSRMVPDGVGELAFAFEQLKNRLYREGLFDSAHKQPIPSFPHTIALVTSPAGAAVRDMIRILGTRWPLAEVLVVPVRVQGEEAPQEICQALELINLCHMADLIITGRGGGTMEDLWAFNEEAVARAIYRSEIPVISAVGHEPDVTIADFVADLRAATPSNGAELAVPDQRDLRETLDHLEARLQSAMVFSSRCIFPIVSQVRSSSKPPFPLPFQGRYSRIKNKVPKAPRHINRRMPHETTSSAPFSPSYPCRCGLRPGCPLSVAGPPAEESAEGHHSVPGRTALRDGRRPAVPPSPDGGRPPHPGLPAGQL